MIDMLKAYYDSKERAVSLETQKQADKDKGNDERHNLKYEVFQPRIDALTNEMSAALDKNEREHGEVADRITAEIGQCVASMREVDQIFRHMLLYRQILEGGEGLDAPVKFSMYSYSDRDEQGNWIQDKRKIMKVPVAVLCQDQYKMLAVYITQNDPYRKRVNKWSLFVVGYSIFNQFNESWKSHGSLHNVHSDTHVFEQVIREAPTEGELLEWWAKRGVPQEFKDWIHDHEQEQSDFLEAVELYKNREWRLAFLRQHKDDILGSYSRATESGEYKSVVEELLILRTPKKELPLIMGKITQEYPRRVWEASMKGIKVA